MSDTCPICPAIHADNTDNSPLASLTAAWASARSTASTHLAAIGHEAAENGEGQEEEGRCAGGRRERGCCRVGERGGMERASGTDIPKEIQPTSRRMRT